MWQLFSVLWKSLTFKNRYLQDFYRFSLFKFLRGNKYKSVNVHLYFSSLVCLLYLTFRFTLYIHYHVRSIKAVCTKFAVFYNFAKTYMWSSVFFRINISAKAKIISEWLFKIELLMPLSQKLQISHRKDSFLFYLFRRLKTVLVKSGSWLTSSQQRR